MKIGLTENRAREIVRECINNILLESSGTVNITNDLRTYIKMARMGEMGDADMSQRACEMHERLMELMDLYHFDEEDREHFAQALSFFSKLLKLNANVAIYADGTNDVRYKIDDEETEYINVYNGIEDFDAVVYKTSDGVIIDDAKWDERARVYHAHLEDYIIKEIKDMGLVPALFITGSYHEKYLYAVGILPSEAYKFNDDNGIFLDCKF